MSEQAKPLSDEEIEKWRLCQERLCQHNGVHRSPSSATCLATIDALRKQVADLQAAFQIEQQCSTCYGTEHASKVPCVCGGANTHTAEIHGLRNAIYDLQARALDDGAIDAIADVIERSSFAVMSSVTLRRRLIEEIVHNEIDRRRTK